MRFILQRLRSPKACSRGSSSIIFLCVTSFSSRAAVLFIGLPIMYCLSKSLVFSPFRPKVLPPRSHSSYLFVLPVQFPGSLSTFCASDATFKAGVRTWVPRRLCRLVSSGWIPPPLPCVMDSGFHTSWSWPITLGTSRSLANYRLHSRETPFPPEDRSSTL